MKQSLRCALVLFAACQPAAKPDGGTGVAPTITSLAPTSGPTTGGTEVIVIGSNLVDGATVTFGASRGTMVTVQNRLRLSVLTPSALAPGPVNVTVTNPDGTSATANNAFTYTETNRRMISAAQLMNPAEMIDASGAPTVTMAVIGQVAVPGLTFGAGQGVGVSAQVGFAATASDPPLASEFTWTDATYLGDADGATTGDLARDQYVGDVSLPGPISGEKTYLLAVRFSLDNGATWVLGDRDGSANGLQRAQLTTARLVAPAIGWCKLGGEAIDAPPALTLIGGATGPTIYGQVYKEGVTSTPSPSSTIQAQLGYGAPGSLPATWTWAAATYNRKSGNGANEEWQAVLPNPGPGTYRFAFRFTHNNGPWSYCDADGLATMGFTEAQAGQLTVQAPSVQRCLLQFPSTLSAREGRPSEVVYGRVFAPGVTDLAGAGAGVEAQLGVGPTGQQPTDGGWQWFASTYNVDVALGGDEFQARLTGPAPGSYVYAYRARLSGGGWTLCDLDDSSNGFSLAQAGALTALPFEIDACQLEAPSTASSLPGAQTASFAARVRVPSLTDVPDAGGALTAEVGTGAIGSAPSSWTNWSPAAFEADDGAFDRFRGVITAPAAEGTVEVAYRFKLGTGAYVYCDGDGLQNGYASAAAGRLAVRARLIEACKLETVSSFSMASGQPLSATLSVLATGSADAGVTPTLTAQIGVGPQNDNASTSALWGWAAASYSGEFGGGRDGFSWLATPAYTGQRAVAGRASLDDGQTWTYCDFVGGDAGFQVSAQFNVQVGASSDFGFCNTQFPTMVTPDGGVTRFYGQVYESGLTPNAAAAIRAEFGLGREAADPGVAWTWVPAPIAGVATLSPNNNEYAIDLSLDGGQPNYAFRFSRNDGGSWCYGDLNGNGTMVDGFSGVVSSTPNLGRVLP